MSPEFDAFVGYWNSLRGDAFAPSWHNFRLADLDPRSIPRVVVVDVVHDPLDFRFRFWGTGHLFCKGMEKTGKMASEIKHLRGGTPYDEYAWVVREKRFLAAVDTVDLRDYNHIQPFTQRVVRLPLSSDGEAVDKIVSLAEWDRR